MQAKPEGPGGSSDKASIRMVNIVPKQRANAGLHNSTRSWTVEAHQSPTRNKKQETNQVNQNIISIYRNQLTKHTPDIKVCSSGYWNFPLTIYVNVHLKVSVEREVSQFGF